MTDPEGYARRVRARPYGPREVEAGGVTVWFHGPFAVLTLTDGRAGLTFRADLDLSSAGSDLQELFAAAGQGVSACLRRPELLVGEQSLADEDRTVVSRFAVRPVSKGVSLTVEASDVSMEVTLSARDIELLADEVGHWMRA
ncbi:hypothetical protein [Actinomadura roseirufa]|uniref:hypothetical protein n=1 Tax=Actinomadura roseirufa TaxID=2094049 RepID=UPI001041525A|nr:hypothetical protein [Actinomadura roseirufa]